jgi:hypothetical protein
MDRSAKPVFFSVRHESSGLVASKPPPEKAMRSRKNASPQIRFATWSEHALENLQKPDVTKTFARDRLPLRKTPYYTGACKDTAQP